MMGPNLEVQAHKCRGQSRRWSSVLLLLQVNLSMSTAAGHQVMGSSVCPAIAVC